VQAQAGLNGADAHGSFWSRQFRWPRAVSLSWLLLAALLFVTAVTAYVADLAAHPGLVLNWYDLNVYNDAGLLTRQLPSILYTWELKVGVQFTYTPFAALVLAGGSLMPLVTLRWIMTAASLISIPLTAWLTLGAMGRRGVTRAAVALAIGALALWTEPVIKALFLGQVELVLLLLVVWDLTRPDRRLWKGVGIGIAAGIKLVPLLFIPYLLLSRKYRQAAVATGVFAATIAVGFVVLPGPSASYWLTGYFMRPGRTGGVDSLVNQSLLGVFARLYHNLNHAQAVWLPVAVAVAVAGLIGGVMMTRAGKPVQGWTLVGIASVLASPISWDHHWVWIIPFIAMLAGIAMTARPLVRIGCIAGIITTAGVMGSWPWTYSGSQAFVPRRGLLGWFVRPPYVTEISVLHGWQLLTWNLFVAIGVVIFLTMLACAWPIWRHRPRPPEPRPPSPSEPAAQAKEPASPITALLAKADAMLKGGAAVGSRS